MLIPAESKFSNYRYVEIANYVPDLKAVIRFQRKVSKDEREPILMEWGAEVERFRKKHKNTGIYTTVFRYPTKDGSVDLSNEVKYGSLYFDLDSEDKVETSFKDARKLTQYLTTRIDPKDIRVYFTGSKGFHIEVEAIALGLSPSRDLHDVFRTIANKIKDKLDLTTLDFAVYDSRRMWRLPYSRHQKTGLHKIELPVEIFNKDTESVIKLARKPFVLKQEMPKFQVRANEWYKEMLAEYAIQKEREAEERAQRRRELFNKYGTRIIQQGHSKKYIKKSWESALSKLREEKNERNTMLSRQAFRIFLMYFECGMELDEAHQVLYDVALEIGLDEREITATLKSAKRAADKKFEEDPIGLIGV